MKLTITGTALICLVAQPALPDDGLPSADLAKAIEYGSQFKSRRQFLEKGIRHNKIQLASAWAKDGISKYVTLFTDFEAVASAAAQARQEMRTFQISDATKLPLTGLVYAHVEIHGRGDLPVRKVARRYIRDAAHLVLQFGENTVQPLSKEFKGARDASLEIPVAVFAWWDSGNVSLLTGGALGISGAKVEMEFVFRLSLEQIKRRGSVILIDGDGNKHKEDVSFAEVLQRQRPN